MQRRRLPRASGKPISPLEIGVGLRLSVGLREHLNDNPPMQVLRHVSGIQIGSMVEERPNDHQSTRGCAHDPPVVIYGLG
jgi:hypothetical protein